MKSDPTEDALYQRVERTISAARASVARSVNLAMVHAYWLIGRDIVEVEQGGEARAGYGDQLIHQLSDRLTARFGRGFGVRTIRRLRSFYLAWPHGSTLLESSAGPAPTAAIEMWTTALSELKPDMVGAAADSDESSNESEPYEIRTTALSESGLRESRLPTQPLFPASLSWSHYLELMKVKRDDARRFYEIEAAREGWSTRQLARQISTLLFERLAMSRDTDGVRALAREGQQVTTPQSALKDPLILEFLDLPERAQWRERELEQAIIDRLESFLLELGKGFCFVARQKRVTLDGDHFFVDLVFYNRLLRCFVLVDLKLGKLTHQDLGQMQMYVNLFDQTQRVDGEAPTVGIVLCSEKNDAMVRITLPSDSQVHASRYQMYLPTEDELSAELTRERTAAEGALRIAALEAGDE